MDSIRVGVRVRPLLKRETEAGQKNSWSVSSNCITHRSSNPQSYCFDNVFHGDVKTSDIFATMALPIVRSVMEGFNGTIFVYGQTSSGKTHTMMGTSDDPGIIPLTIHEVFSYIEQCVSREFILRLSYLEIYNETLTDLLNPENKNLKIRENTEHTVSVHGITECAVTLASEVVDLLCFGDQNRVIGETNMNERSSRSHTIVTMAIESRERDEEEGGGRDGPVKVSSINLVDLAGSERVSTNGAEWTNVRFKEGTFINLSLLTLGNVIAKLSEGSSAHIPFRDSKLTRILQPSLGGNAKTCIICTITPASVEETHSTLKFAGRAKQIQNKPIVNEVLLGEAALVKKLKSYEKENDELKHKLAERLPEEEKAKLALLLADSEKEKNELEQKIRSLQEMIVRSSVTLKPKATAIDRRRTVCSALLTRAEQDIPQSLVHPTISTPAGNRHTLQMFSPLFTPHFDKKSFEKHLDSLDVTPITVDRRHVKFVSRPSFIPTLRCATLETSEGLETTTGSSNAAGCVTAVCVQMVDTYAQTEQLVSTSTSTARTSCCVPDMNVSYMCEHRQKLQSTMETLETVQFERDENHILRQDNAKLQAEMTELKMSLDVHISKSSNQEEIINQLQLELVGVRTAVQEKQGQIDQYERECHAMSSEVCELRQHLEGFKKAVEKSQGNPVLEALKSELEAVKYKADQDAKHFQGCYEQKVLEVNKVNFKVSALEEKLQDAYAELMSYEAKVKELTRALEDGKPKLQQYAVTLEEKEELISSLQNTVITANKRTEEEVKKIRTQYEGYLSQAESFARDLQAKLNERTSSPESTKHTIANLKAELQQLQSRYEEKTTVTAVLQAKVEELNSLWQSTKDQLEEKMSESSVVNKSTTPRRWAAVSFEEEAAVCAREEEMQHLSEQLKKANCTLEEKEATISQLQQCCMELQSQLKSSTAALEDKEKAHAHLEQECKELEEKVAFHAHLEQECKELEEKVAFHAHLEQECKELEEKVAFHAHLEQECKELEEKVAFHAHLEQECKELEEKVAFHAHLEQECKELKEKVAFHAHLEQECKELEEKVALLQEGSSLEVVQSRIDELSCSLQCTKDKLEEKEGILCEKEARVSKLTSQLQKHVASLQDNEVIAAAQEKKIVELQGELERATIVTEDLRCASSDLEKKVEELQDTAAMLQEEASLASSLRSRMDDLSSLLHSTRDELEEKEMLVDGQVQKISELSSQLHKALQDNESLAAAQQDLQSQCEHLTALMREKEDTVSSQGKQILELHTQLKTSVAALEEKEKAYFSLQKTADVSKTQIIETVEKAATWETECKKKSEEVHELCGAKRQLTMEKEELLSQMGVLQLKLENATAELKSLKVVVPPQVTPDQLRTTQKALEENTCLVASLQSRAKELTDELEKRKTACTLSEKRIAEYEKATTDLQAQLTKAIERGDVWEAEYNKRCEEVDDCCRVERQLMNEKDEMEAEIGALKSKLESVTAQAESIKVKTAQKALEDKTLATANLQSRMMELRNELEERKGACAHYEKRINEYETAASALQAQLAKAIERSDVWEAEYKKRCEEVDDLCRAEKQLLDEKDELLLKIVELKSKPKEADSSKQFESYQSQITELKSALQLSRSEMEAQLAKAIERGDVWEAEYNKRCEEVDDCCRVERQLMNEKDEMEAEIGALKSKLDLVSKELEGAKNRVQELQKDNEHSRSKLQSEALKLELAERELEEAKKVQQGIPPDHAVSANEERSYKARIQELQKDNDYLRSKLQSEALKPAGLTTSSVANDGSGFVTGVAYYEMLASKRAVEKENEKLIAKLDKLKAEIVSLQSMLQKEREDVKKYRSERNIYRVKYEKLKGIDSATSINTAGSSPEKKEGPVIVAEEEEEDSAVVAAAAEKCPTPRRTRKSILSFPANVQRPMQDNLKAPVRLSSNPSTNTGKEKVEGSHSSTVPPMKSANPETLPGSMPPARPGPPPASSIGSMPPARPGPPPASSIGSQLVAKDTTTKDATAGTTSIQDGLLLKKEKDTAPAMSMPAKLFQAVPGGGKAALRQPLTNMNSGDQAVKRKDEDKGRKSILSFPPDSGASLHPYALPVGTKKAKFEDDLAQNPQPSSADPNDCKSQ
eukprot:Em0009g400a